MSTSVMYSRNARKQRIARIQTATSRETSSATPKKRKKAQTYRK